MTPNATAAVSVKASARYVRGRRHGPLRENGIHDGGVHLEPAHLACRHRDGEHVVERRGRRADDDDLAAERLRPLDWCLALEQLLFGVEQLVERHAPVRRRAVGAPAAIVDQQASGRAWQVVWAAAEHDACRGKRERRNRSALITHEWHVPAPRAVGVEHREVVRDRRGPRRRLAQSAARTPAVARHGHLQPLSRAGLRARPGASAALARLRDRIARKDQRHGARRGCQRAVGRRPTPLLGPGRRTSLGRLR